MNGNICQFTNIEKNNMNQKLLNRRYKITIHGINVVSQDGISTFSTEIIAQGDNDAIFRASKISESISINHVIQISTWIDSGYTHIVLSRNCQSNETWR